MICTRKYNTRAVPPVNGEVTGFRIACTFCPDGLVAVQAAIGAVVVQNVQAILNPVTSQLTGGTTLVLYFRVQIAP